MWLQKWGVVQLWFWLNCTVKCGAKNVLKPHHTELQTPLIVAQGGSGDDIGKTNQLIPTKSQCK